MSLVAPAELADAFLMASKSNEHRQLFYHPLLSMRELESQLPREARISVTVLRSISLRIGAFANGTAKRNKDFKDLAGFSNHGLFELRRGFRLRKRGPEGEIDWGTLGYWGGFIAALALQGSLNDQR